MSYLVLARKWRPQVFDDLIGQEPITRVLKNSIDQGRIAHAYLFSGPRGVGKTSTARILAKALNCKDGPTSAPCGACPFCTSITDGSSVDVIEIDGASNNSVNDIRDLRERVKYVPSGGRYKVYIIDETHMLSDAAFNALLKTLEEPPPHVVFVLATTAPRKIPSTVLSRCQHLPFRRIHSSRIKERLKRIAESEGITITGPAIEMVARAADGSLRDSLTILDQIISFSSDISETEVKDLLGITDFGLLSQLSLALIEGRREEIITITGELIEKGTDIRSFTKELIQFLRNVLVVSIVRKPDEVLDLGTEEIDSIRKILARTSEDHLTLLLAELLKAEVDIRNASSSRLAFEMLLLKASFLREMTPLKEIIENLNEYLQPGAGTRKPPGDPSGAKKKPDAAPAGKEPASREMAQAEQPGNIPLSGRDTKATATDEPCHGSLTDEIWERVMKKMDPPLASKLSMAGCSLQGSKLVLTLNGGYAVFSDSLKKNKKRIEQLFSEEIGTQVTLSIETEGKKTIRKKDLKEEAMADPVIKEVLQLFDGRIVDVGPITDGTK